MSLCLIYQSKNQLFMGADTAISVEGKRRQGIYEKLYESPMKHIFIGGIVPFADKVKEFTKNNPFFDLEDLQKYCRSIYGTEDYYYNENGERFLCEIVIGTINEYGQPCTYLLSSTKGFKIENNVVEDDRIDVFAFGINNNEAIKQFEIEYKKVESDKNISVNKLFKKVFENVVSEEVGGYLTLGSVIPQGRSLNIRMDWYKLEDRFNKKGIEELYNLYNSHLFLGLEKDISGVRKTKLRLMSANGEELLISEDGLCLKDQVNFVDNLDYDFPMIIPYRVDEGIKEIRKAILSLYFYRYRAFERSAKSNKIQTSSNGGGFSITASGGNKSATVTSPQKEIFTGLEGNVYDEYGNKLGHNHSMKHSHTFSINTYHEHNITQKAHSHTLDPHSHELEYGIFEDTLPSDVAVYVNNRIVTSRINDKSEIDITKYIELNKLNEIKITSKTRGRIVANLWMSNFSFF